MVCFSAIDNPRGASPSRFRTIIHRTEQISQARSGLDRGRTARTCKSCASLSQGWPAGDTVKRYGSDLIAQCSSVLPAFLPPRSSSTGFPSTNFVSSSSGMTRCGLRILFHRFCAIVSNKKPIVSPLARKPATFVTRCRSRTITKADSLTLVLRIDCQCATGTSKNVNLHSRSMRGRLCRFSSRTGATVSMWSDRRRR